MIDVYFIRGRQVGTQFYAEHEIIGPEKMTANELHETMTEMTDSAITLEDITEAARDLDNRVIIVCALDHSDNDVYQVLMTSPDAFTPVNPTLQ